MEIKKLKDTKYKEEIKEGSFMENNVEYYFRARYIIDDMNHFDIQISSIRRKDEIQLRPLQIKNLKNKLRSELLNKIKCKK